MSILTKLSGLTKLSILTKLYILTKLSTLLSILNLVLKAFKNYADFASNEGPRRSRLCEMATSS